MPIRLIAAAALAASLASAAVASESGAYYRAELAAPAAEARLVAGGMVWLCAGNACAAAKDNSRPLTVCKRLARQAPAVTRFSAGGKAFAPDELARCNG